MKLGGWSFPLSGKTTSKLLTENFGLTVNEYISRYHKWGEVFPLSQKGQVVSIIIVFFLCLQNIVEGEGDIIFCIFIGLSDKDSVSLALLQVADLKIPSEALSAIWHWLVGDLPV